MEDAKLLCRYAFERSEAAFAELVRRHVDLVHSAARRQVRSAQLADEVAQSVFLELAHQAGRVRCGTSLAPWLYVITRRKSVDVIRRESRRQRREQIAWEGSLMKTTPAAWTQLEPYLDEAMAGLDAADQRAVVLRFFENMSFREIGNSVGASEDAAQKRVSRALERLRLFYVKKGVAATAAGLAGEIAAHAVEAAPSTLAASITHAATASTVLGIHGLAFLAGRSLTMTLTQKILATTVILAAIGGAIFEAPALAAERQAIDHLTKELAGLEAASRQLMVEKDQSRAELDRIALSENSASSLSEAQVISRGIARLKHRIAKDPRLAPPEFQYLTANDWILAVEPHRNLESETEYRKVFAALREDAAREFETKMKDALGKYLKSTDGQMPSDLSQLLPYFDSNIDPAAFSRYTINSPPSSGGDPSWKISLRPEAAIDPEFDRRVNSGSDGGWSSLPIDYFLMDTAIRNAERAYRAANGLLHMTDPHDLVPYFTNSTDAAKFAQILNNLDD